MLRIIIMKLQFIRSAQTRTYCLTAKIQAAEWLKCAKKRSSVWSNPDWTELWHVLSPMHGQMWRTIQSLLTCVFCFSSAFVRSLFPQTKRVIALSGLNMIENAWWSGSILQHLLVQPPTTPTRTRMIEESWNRSIQGVTFKVFALMV